jgi:tRNA U34 2-thiouridine synthase MnmA/TrmU
MHGKALALFSGGLDSTLAVKIMLDQGIEIEAVNFTSLFCNCNPRKEGCVHQASRAAREFGIPIRVLAKGMEYMKMVERPRHGYGRGMNPCIDCRIYMLRKVRELLPEAKASFVVTGEVLGQRPMSQHRRAIEVIERESGLGGLILRPLSARLLPPTIPENEGIVDRPKLLDLAGRSRKPQMALADAMGITDYPCPAGGCLLTDRVVAARLRDLFRHHPDYTMTDLQLLRYGRHFRLDAGLKAVAGRDEEENRRIRALADGGNTLFQPLNFRGPAVVARGILGPGMEDRIGRIMARYSQDSPNGFTIERRNPDGGRTTFSVDGGLASETVERWRVGCAGLGGNRSESGETAG